MSSERQQPCGQPKTEERAAKVARKAKEEKVMARMKAANLASQAGSRKESV